MIVEANQNTGNNHEPVSAVRWFLKFGVVSFCILFFSFPVIHDLFPTFRELPPFGVTQITPTLSLNRQSYVTRAYQRKAEQLAKKRSGLWRPFTLIGNEIVFRGFNQVTPFHSGSVFMGGDGQLVQTLHLDSFNRKAARKGEGKKVLEQLSNLKLLQDFQAKRGKSVIAVISPNVTEIYPETVPKRYRAAGREKRDSAYDRFKRDADRIGINYVDGPKILMQAKQNFPFRMYARTGSHWNDVASCLVLQQLNEQLKKAGTANLPEFECTPWNLEFPLRDKDIDLLKIANLFLPERLYEPAPYVQFTPVPKSTKRPVITMSGSSYLFAFAESFKKRNLSEDHVHYFYYRQRKSRNSPKFIDIQRNKMPWDVILNREITIVEAPMRGPSAIGYGFIADAVKNLDKVK